MFHVGGRDKNLFQTVPALGMISHSQSLVHINMKYPLLLEGREMNSFPIADRVTGPLSCAGCSGGQDATAYNVDVTLGVSMGNPVTEIKIA